MPQALVGVGILFMLAATVVGFASVFFYVVFYTGLAMVPVGLAWLAARSYAPR